ncbi:MAG TPA: DUF1353 domain-containing protein [Candidatus Absconditabacterales bacterium]|nr:DUF1353 domain-containing protein [Candidatus Absconditabacterales bacterium]
MRFTDAIRVKHNGLLRKLENDKFEVAEEFFWYLDYENKNPIVIIPKGFVTNFGSMPRFARPFFNPVKYLGYCLHDYLFSKEGKIIYVVGKTACEVKYTRKEADLILRASLKVEGAGFFERNMIYYAVRIFGKSHYER